MFQDNLRALIINTSGKHDIFWFIPCLIMSNIIVCFLISVTYNKTTVLAFVSIVIALLGSKIKISFPWHIEVAMVAQIFMVFGYLSKKYNLVKKITDIRFYRSIIVPALYCTFTALDKILNDKRYDLHISEYGSGIVIYMFLAFLGIISTLCLLRYIPNNKVIARIGQNSLLFYAFQYSVITILNICFARIRFDKFLDLNVLTRSLATVLYLSTCIIVCYSLSLIINNYFPEVIGRKRRIKINVPPNTK